MLGKQYKAHKDNTIDIFNSYLEKKGNINDGVDSKYLESRINLLKNGKFTFAVAGEVKAGKSTFLNALLGAEILPSDVLQASNAIVEIYKSDVVSLEVKFADGHDETTEGESSTERLHQISKINDKYRNIPTTLIDDYIIENDEKLVVSDTFLKNLEQQSQEDLEDQQDIVNQYVSERTKDKIPVEIKFGYPLKWDFDEFSIVDTPGVNATGGVQDMSLRFFEEANAILFVHPIKPIESESFKKFVNSVISNRSKETLFLVLTHAGQYTNDEVERLHKEAGRLYKNIIPEERILVVDSLLKLIHNDLAKGVSLTEIRQSEKKKVILSRYREQAYDEKRELIDVVCEGSRFEEMLTAIDEFSMKAPTIQIKEILEQIKKGYEEQETQYKDHIRRSLINKENPQKFENEIGRIKKALDGLERLIPETKEKLIRSYSGRDSSWNEDINNLKIKYPELITDSNSIVSVRKNMIDGLDEVQEKADKYSKNLIKELNKILDEEGKKFSDENQISTPKVDLKALEQKAKESACKKEKKYKTYYKSHWYTLWLVKTEHKKCIGSKVVINNEKFLAEYKRTSLEEFHKIINVIPDMLKAFSKVYLDLFERDMKELINDKQCALDDEYKNKQSNAEIIVELKDLKGKLKAINAENLRCIELLEDLK